MMIKLPKEIARMIKTIEDAGFEAYAVGGCVRDSILGRHPEDWDLTSNASRETLEALFPDASIVNKKLGVMRISVGGVTADIAAYRIDGEYKDYRRPDTVIFTEEIGEDLKRRDFTMNAIAVSPDRGVIDPYHGREDIERRLIRGIGDPRVRFEEDALRILRAVRFTAQLDFETDDETLQSMKEKAELLEFISIERIREEFAKTITAHNAGKGLRLFAETGVLPHILGKDCVRDAGEAERHMFARLAENIDRTENELKLRLGLVYGCFEENRALSAIERLGYSNEMNRLLQCAVNLTGEFNEIRDKSELKGFLSRNGLEIFRYLADLSEQRCSVYQLDEAPLRAKLELLNEIKNNHEPVFIKDLAVNGNDLITAGMQDGREIGRILQLLLVIVHKEPERNRKERLLEIAAEYYGKGPPSLNYRRK